MSENESYSEAVVESVMEAAHTETEKELAWNRWIALTTLLLTVVSAICALGASMSSHEGSRFRDETTLAIAEQSGKRSVIHILKSQKRLFTELKLPVDREVDAVISELEKESVKLQHLANVSKQTAEVEKQTHHLFEFTSTILGVAISFCGLAILLRRKWIWYTGLGVGSIATCLVCVAFAYRISFF
ncbi:MAG: DUF4337 domain-containing protein [Gammaproteobacteria bacterium]|nr:DUF4337 domain-containing protein [Gammaproteobacteria bacterium]